jgi:hypothetical protein
MAVTFTLELRGKPLRHTYVSHFDFFRVPQTLVFRTNAEGRVTIENANHANVTADPTGPSGEITVTVHAQNSVVRVLDGNFPFPVEVSQSFKVKNGGTANINSDREQQDHFRVMDSCRDAYETVFQQFRPFNRSSRGLFPLGKKASAAATRSQPERIEVVYPDRGVQPISYVEPISLTTGYPLLHLKEGVLDAGTIAHELAHALHFALMSATTRASVEAQYLAWLTSRVAAGQPPFHNIDLATSPLIAWLEALGHFAERFFTYSKGEGKSLSGGTRRSGFFRDELSDTPSLRSMPGYLQVGKIEQGVVVPKLTGENVEGALYGAVFLDFARRVGLRGAVGQVFDSAADSVLNLDDFRNMIIRETDSDADIREVVNTWRV